MLQKKYNTHDKDDVALRHVILAARVGHSRVNLRRDVSEAAARSTASATNRVPTKYTNTSILIRMTSIVIALKINVTRKSSCGNRKRQYRPRLTSPGGGVSQSQRGGTPFPARGTPVLAGGYPSPNWGRVNPLAGTGVPLILSGSTLLVLSWGGCPGPFWGVPLVLFWGPPRQDQWTSIQDQRQDHRVQRQDQGTHLDKTRDRTRGTPNPAPRCLKRTD